MEIYNIAQDFGFKELLFKNDNSSSQTLEFKGQSLKNGWKPLSLYLYKGKTKQEIKKREDFDASCFYNGNLFIKKDFEKLFYTFLGCTFLGDKIELLPVIVDSCDDTFLFLNVLNCFETIDFSNLNTYEEKMNILRGDKIKFIKNNVTDKIIFRDKIITSFYYCTEEFISFTETNGIKGLTFKKIGYTI